MSLQEIRHKEPTVATPSAHDLAAAPEVWESKFKFHVATYVSVGNLEARWNAIIDNLLKNRSATGLLYADKGYGKTSTGAALWQAAEAKQIVTVPPFVWGSLADMLTATHAWICYRLQDTRPELIPDVEQKHREIVEVDEETLAQRLVREEGLSYDEARNVITRLKREGRLLDALSPDQLLDYLRFATQILLESGYKGLLMLPDEFELFQTNPDISQNYQNLKDFIFGLYGKENLPIGCIAFTYNRTFADIEFRANHILDRFNKPEGSLINLEQLYGQEDFAKYLWKKLALTRQLSPSECNAVDTDVLEALGQFLRHPRSRELMSGPRSIVRTFNRAAQHYLESNRPYSIFDFCDDYLSGNISYGSQESETASAYNQIVGSSVVQDTTDGDKIVKLLCVHPEGIPYELFQKHGVSEQARDIVIQELLGEHVNIKVTGPTLKVYRDDLLGVDELNEILKMLRGSFSPMDKEFHRAAVRAFRKHILPEIFTKKIGTGPGWTHDETDGNFGFHRRLDAKGTILSEYPDRTLTVDVATEILSNFPPFDSQFRTQFTLDTTNQVNNACCITANSLDFRFNVQQPIDAQRVPVDIGKLGELFLPESITPLLLLSILDFFDDDPIISMVEAAKQEAEVGLLKEQIRDELIRYFFPHEIKTRAHFNPAELSTDFQSVAAGKGFVENVLRILIPKQFPDYAAVATAPRWRTSLGNYMFALSRVPTLAIRRGIEPMSMANPDIPGHFNLGGISAFRNFNNVVGRELLTVKDDAGVQVEVTNRQGRVNVFFTLHRFENQLIEQIQNSATTVVVEGKTVNAVARHDIHEQTTKIGYTKEEIEALVDILKARGMVQIINETGIEYFYLIDMSINFSELETKLSDIENVIKLAESKGFDYQYEGLSSARSLIQTIGIENDEVQKDELQQKLNSTENHLEQYCREMIRTEQKLLEQQIKELENICLPVPKVLEQQTENPPVDFSQILFDDIQTQVKHAYTGLSNQIRRIQAKVRDTLDREVGTYQSEQTSHKAIEIADRLKSERLKVETQIKNLNQKRDEAQELFNLFEPWRLLAQEVHSDKNLMKNSREDMTISNLISRLDDVVRDIRQHLADKRRDLKDILSSREYFKTQVETIKKEFTQFLTGKKDKFVEYQSKIEEKLRPLLRAPLSLVDFNPIESEGCYRKVRENTVSALRTLIDEVLSENKNRQRELLKPIEVFKVSEALKTKAIQLREKLEKLAEKFQGVRLEFTVEAVDEKLLKWVENLNEKLAEGQAISERRRQLERELDEFVPEPSPRAQRLRDELTSQQDTDFTELIVHLLGDETFSSTTEILESLEELYQANLINLTVHRK